MFRTSCLANRLLKRGRSTLNTAPCRTDLNRAQFVTRFPFNRYSSDALQVEPRPRDAIQQEELAPVASRAAESLIDVPTSIEPSVHSVSIHIACKEAVLK